MANDTPPPPPPPPETKDAPGSPKPAATPGDKLGDSTAKRPDPVAAPKPDAPGSPNNGAKDLTKPAATPGDKLGDSTAKRPDPVAAPKPDATGSPNNGAKDLTKPAATPGDKLGDSTAKRPDPVAAPKPDAPGSPNSGAKDLTKPGAATSGEKRPGAERASKTPDPVAASRTDTPKSPNGGPKDTTKLAAAPPDDNSSSTGRTTDAPNVDGFLPERLDNVDTPLSSDQYPYLEAPSVTRETSMVDVSLEEADDPVVRTDLAETGVGWPDGLPIDQRPVTPSLKDMTGFSGEIRPYTMEAGKTYYRVVGDGQKAAGSWWTDERPTDEAYVRGPLAVANDINGDNGLISFTPSKDIPAWDGVVAPKESSTGQGDLPGEGHQIYVNPGLVDKASGTFTIEPLDPLRSARAKR